jgi:AraC-like DNA-binding protein
MAATDSTAVSVLHLPILGGVELLTARYVDQRFSRHFHEDYALGVIEDGALAFRYRGEGLVAAPGEINLTVPGEVHDGHPAADSGWAYRMFYLPTLALKSAAGRVGDSQSAPYFPRAVLSDPMLAREIALVHRALCEPATPTLEKETRLLSLLAAWTSRHAIDPPAAPKPGPIRPALRRVTDYIADSLAEDIRLDDLARLADLSPFHLIRVFTEHTGLPPHAYLVAKRLGRARELLGTPLRLAEVAADAGFADQAHLTRLFKRRYGITPGAYRNFLQNKSPRTS